mgnify:CR=1 FL=1
MRRRFFCGGRGRGWVFPGAGWSFIPWREQPVPTAVGIRSCPGMLPSTHGVSPPGEGNKGWVRRGSRQWTGSGEMGRVRPQN